MLLQQINISYKGERLMNSSHYEARDTQVVFLKLCSSMWCDGKRLVQETDITASRLPVDSQAYLRFQSFIKCELLYFVDDHLVEEHSVVKPKVTHDLIWMLPPAVGKMGGFHISILETKRSLIRENHSLCQPCILLLNTDSRNMTTNPRRIKSNQIYKIFSRNIFHKTTRI